VLAGRCADIVVDRESCPDVLRILVVTFTDLAAEQMRHRIGEELRSVYTRRRDPHTRYQLMLLGAADISTIHSFCKRIITEHFHRLGLDPAFGVLDEDEQRLLTAEVLEKTIEWAWTQSHLAEGLGQLLRRRDLRSTGGFMDKIIAVSNFLDGLVARDRWYDRAVILSEWTDELLSGLGQRQKQIVGQALRDIHAQLEHARGLYERECPGGEWLERYLNNLLQPVRQCIEYFDAGDWAMCAEGIRSFSKPNFSKPKDVDGNTAELLKRLVKEAKERFKSLSQLALLNPEYLNRLNAAASIQTRVFVELVKKFEQLYAQAKGRINCLDFADLQRYALRLLSKDVDAEPLEPSEVALALQKRYKYIFVDEYQDINPVQQAILDLLKSEKNVFVVGDVKQSIYAFRGAAPGIFLERLKKASADTPGSERPLCVDLNTNWRSDPGILRFVNALFGRIMTASVANIDYDASAELRPGAVVEQPPGKAGGSVVELHILGESDRSSGRGGENEQDSNPDQAQVSVSPRHRRAALIARRIKQMVGADTGECEFQVFDKQAGRFRDVEYRDIVVLMRSPKPSVNDYVEILRLAGVPVSCPEASGYFERTEISDCLCLLKVLDNPLRDIELAAVLRSPFFGISDSELAEVRLHADKNELQGRFWDLLVGYCEKSPGKALAKKLKAATEQLQRWRAVARRGRLADLLWQVYRETEYIAFVSALPNGDERRANLLRLHDRAVQFEGFASNGGIGSVGRFVEFIERMTKTGRDWSSAEPEAEAVNAVRIMSVHKSKGLEFPVVILAEMNSNFNKSDYTNDIVAHPKYAIGLQVIDGPSNSKLASLAHQVIAEEKYAESLAEEMRILYVATTRARERLILTGTAPVDTCRRIATSGVMFGEKPIPAWRLRRCSNHLEWLLYGLSRQRELHSVLGTGLSEQAEGSELFEMQLYTQAELEELTQYVTALRNSRSKRKKYRPDKADQKQSGLLQQVKESLSWRYPFAGAALLPAKQSVTELTHHNDEYVRFDYDNALEKRPAALVEAASEQVDGRVVGTATHIVIATLDFSKPVTRNMVEAVIDELVQDGQIAPAVAGKINIDAIAKFFETELGLAARQQSNRVRREWPFTLAVGASELPGRGDLNVTGCEGEKIIVQGIIDMVIETPESLLVVDFKTDRVNQEQLAERSGLYRDQLELYGKAAEAILGKGPVEKWLYFLEVGCGVRV